MNKKAEQEISRRALMGIPFELFHKKLWQLVKWFIQWCGIAMRVDIYLWGREQCSPIANASWIQTVFDTCKKLCRYVFCFFFLKTFDDAKKDQELTKNWSSTHFFILEVIGPPLPHEHCGHTTRRSVVTLQSFHRLNIINIEFSCGWLA